MLTKNEVEKMAGNTGKIDQAIRLILGSVLIGSLAFNVYPQHQTLIGGLGVYLIMAGYSGTCLIYGILRLNTCKGETDHLIPEQLR